MKSIRGRTRNKALISSWATIAAIVPAWQTILGNFPADVFEDNNNPWSGDHCMDYTLVPGVLLSNRPIAAPSPALTDIAPTIFAEFGIPKPGSMMGHSVF